MDTGLQAALSMGVPALAELVGILINNIRLSDLREHRTGASWDWRSTLTKSCAALGK
jgi:hypothetical protein